MHGTYDLVVIGAGPGGYAAAIRAAELGLRTLCIDKRGAPGGTCLHVGCIPSKTLLHQSERIAQADRSEKTASFARMMEEKREVIERLQVDAVKGLRQPLLTFQQGEASFLDPRCLEIRKGSEVSHVKAERFILATGSAPIALPQLKFDERQVLSSTGALNLTKIPQKMGVVGGGAIGLELASVYSRLGTRVTVIELLDRLCPSMDRAISRGLLQSLEKQGIEFLLSSQITTAIVQPEEVILTITREKEIRNLGFEKLLVAIGRKPDLAELKLENAAVYPDAKGRIPVNDSFQTVQPHIFAIGDLVEGPMLAHLASLQGRAVVEWALGSRNPIQEWAVPQVIYTDPEAASVGLSETEARALGLDIKNVTVPFKGNARACCTQHTEGFVKIIADSQSQKILGIHILGAHASELIGIGVAALSCRCSVSDLSRMPFAHPTLSEAIQEAAHLLQGAYQNSH